MKAAVIGAGNVAWHLAPALDRHCHVCNVFSRDIDHASALAARLGNATPIDNVADIDSDIDLAVVCVKDNAIAAVLDAVPEAARDALWLHTSGGCGIEVFGSRFRNCGVLYPLQTFTRDAAVDVDSIPFFIEGNSEATLQRIRTIAEMLSPTVFDADSDTRRKLHIAAVFACNFTNHLCALARDILAPTGIPFSALMPLIDATVEKLRQMPPEKAQTGPAVRGDSKVINAHLGTISDENIKNIYSIITNSIINYHK